MKTIKLIIPLLFFSLMGFTLPENKTTYRVSIYDELAPIYPDMVIDEPVTSYTIDVCRGSIAGVDLFITDLSPQEPLRFYLTGKKLIDKFYANWFVFKDVPVTENTGLINRTEKSDGQVNPYVIRKAPFRIYEALDPILSGFIPGAPTVALRMEIPIGKEFPTGRHQFTIHLLSKGQQEKLTVTVNVYPIEIPPVNQAHLNYVNWMNLSNICKDHQVEMWSEPFWGMLRKYAQLMAHGRQNTFWFIWSDFFRFNPDGSVAEFYEQRLDRYISTFLTEGLSTIQGAPFARRRDWSTDAFLLSIPTADHHEIQAVSDEGRQVIRSMAEPIIALMKKNDWESRWVQGVFDEPTDEYVERYKSTVAFLKSMKPDLRILEATMTVSLAGIVDCWCPQVQEYQKNEPFFESRKAAGDAVWVYTCLAPGGPWINRLVDQERLRQVYVGWACAKYDLQGFLHWGLNFHRGNPYEELVRQHDGEKNYLPAGDSHIIYPGKNGPLSSQRFEAHRIGMEDYELLFMLKKQNPDLHKQLIDKLFQAFDRYDTNISDYREVKKEILDVLSGSTI